MAAQNPVTTIALKPELSLLASIAHDNPIDRLPRVYYEPESVGSSVKIGEGITFTVTRKRVPDTPHLEPRAVEKDKIIVTASTDHLKARLPAYIVYKIPEIHFGPTGHAVTEGANERNLASVLIEFFALAHPPIKQYPFLPDLLGFAWGQNKFTIDQRIPIPVVDYSEFGNLSAFQEQRTLGPDEKRQICWQAGSALAFLHECGICHGDVKAENVLLYPPRQGYKSYTAKLTDFGLARLSQEGSFNFLPPGTRLWAAPEIRTRQQSSSLDKADAYSFGLLVWRVFCDGVDPLCPLFVDPNVRLPQSVEEACQQSGLTSRIDDSLYDRLVENDGLIYEAASMRWRAQAFVQNHLTRDSGLSKIGVQLLVKAFEKVQSQRLTDVDPFCWLITVFERTLSKFPEARDLSAALQALADGQEYRKPQIQATELSASSNPRFRQAAMNANPISWLAMRNLHPQVCEFILSQRVKRADMDAQNAFKNIHLGNAACLISGMGSDINLDIERGLKEVSTAARLDNKEAGGIIFRLYSAFGKEPPNDIDYVPKMHSASIFGSVAAYEDLKIVGGELAQSVRTSLLQQTCGVGANFFWDHQCLNGWKFSDRSKLDWIHDVLSSSKKPDSIAVNKRGDSFLHAAASLNIADLIPTLLEQYHFNVNQQNTEGETPLLCALRAGAFLIAQQLLDQGADPSIISKRCESPFHWLISITELGQKSMMEKLIAKGGLHTVTCWAQMCEYAATEIPSFHQYSERLSKGTPLHWAICRKKPFLIRLLLENGAPAHFYGPYPVFYSSYEQASYLHEAALLRLLIEKTAPYPRHPCFSASNRATITTTSKDGELPVGKRLLGGVPEMVKAAIDGSDRYSLLIRHGDRYRSQMRRTFQILGREMEYSTFTMGVDGVGRTPLHYAAMHGYEEAVECLFQYTNAEKDVNVQYGPFGLTPICEAIKRNHRSLFHELLQHGARLDIKIDNPAGIGRHDWGLLHIAAMSVLRGDLSIAKKLVELGVSIDEHAPNKETSESPLCVAVESNQFELADFFRKVGAKINALSDFISRPQIKLRVPTTPLGRIVAANMRYSSHKIRYLLYPRGEAAALEQPGFVVEPSHGYSALHWCLVADEMVDGVIERDKDNQNDIFALLVEKFDNAEEINLKTKDTGQTALHIAVSKGSLHAVTMLLDYEADGLMEDLDGRTPLELAVNRLESLENQPGTAQSVEEARLIVTKLTDSLESDEE